MLPQKAERSSKTVMASILKSRSNNIESLDTNILLRRIICDNEAQVKKVENFLLTHNCDFYVDDSVISECVYVLTKNDYDRDFIVTALTTYLSNKMFIYDRALFAEVFPYYLSHPSLSFEDCYLTFKVAELQAEPLWTFDHKFATQSPSAKELK